MAKQIVQLLTDVEVDDIVNIGWQVFLKHIGTYAANEVVASNKPSSWPIDVHKKFTIIF